jgi:hypothetical protein
VSEYKISVLRSKWQFWQVKGALLLCLLSIWLWPLWLGWQWVIQLILSLLVVSGGLFKPFEAGIAWQFVLSDSGEVQLVDEAGVVKSFTLAASTVTSDWFCYLVFAPQGVMAERHKRRYWVFRDGVDEREYRRICRVAQRIRRGY